VSYRLNVISFKWHFVVRITLIVSGYVVAVVFYVAGGIELALNEERSMGSTASLIVSHIPPTLNNISTINDFFSKFGVVINVQVGQRY